MVLNVVAPSRPRPMGGTVALYEFANAMARRGHVVRLLHLPMWNASISGLEELAWFAFHPAVDHFVPPHDARRLPPGDVIFGTGATDLGVGLPVQLVQGRDMLDPELERASFLSPGLKVCVATWLVDELVELGVPEERVAWVPMGIDHARFRPTTPIGSRPPHRVAMLFHEHPAKGARAGLRALGLVRERVPDLEVVCFGIDPAPEDLPPWVEYHHDPAPDDLVALYNRSGIFLQPSLHEGFGFTAVEAMACGCALVSTDNGGSRDYALPGETALLAPPDDWGSSLVAPLLEVLGDDALRRRLATAGERHVRTFDWDHGAEVLEGHLERYLADPRAYGIEPPPAW